MKTICAWCQPTPAGETVSHGICAECEVKHFPELVADCPETANGRDGGAVGSTREGERRRAVGIDFKRIARWKDDALLGAVRRLIAYDGGTQDPDCLPGIEVGEPRRSLFFQRKNRFRPGRLGNMLLRTGALRRVV